MHFVIWGIINGIYVILFDISKILRNRFCQVLRIDKATGGWKILSGLLTFFLIDFAWLFFRVGIDEALYISHKIATEFDFFSLFYSEIWAVFVDMKTFLAMLLSLALLGVVDYLRLKGIDWREIIFRQQIVCRWMVYVAIILIIIMWGAYGDRYEQAQFIYFQF